jgi:uroporphyrinogen decarboxylase
MKNKNAMTSYERMMMALEAKEPDRTPVFPLVRDWAIRQAGFTVSEVIQDVAKLVYTQFFCLKKFGYDTVRDLSAVHAESEAMGCKLDIKEDGSPAVIDSPVKDYDEDLPRLRIPNPWTDGRLPLILEGIKRLKGMCAQKVPVIAYIQAPFRHASMLRGFDNFMRDLYKMPDKAKALLEITTLSQIYYGIACVHAGADIAHLSDPTSSGDAVSPKVWEEFGLPYTKKVVEALKKMGVKITMHICGDTTDRLESLALTGVDGLSLDHKVDLVYAKKVVGDRVCLMGNLNPTDSLVFKSADQVYEEAQNLISAMGPSRFILSSGCSIPANAPPENIEAMVKAAKGE